MRFFSSKIRVEISKATPIDIPIETGLMIDTEFEFQMAKLIIENNHKKENA